MIVVTNCGHDSKHKKKFQMIRKTGVPNYILLLVKTEAFFEIKGNITVILCLRDASGVPNLLNPLNDESVLQATIQRLMLQYNNHLLPV